MLNRLRELFFIDKENSLLTKEQESSVIHDIEMINLKRMKLLLIILLIIELLFIVFNDIPNIINVETNILWRDKRFFIVHILLLLVSFCGIIYIKYLIKNDKGQFKKAYSFVVPALTAIILILISIINGLDQINSGNITSVFIANILVCSATLMIRFPIDLAIYSISFLTYIAGLFSFQKNVTIIYSNIINGIIFFIAVIIISRIIYNTQFNQMSKNIILEEVNAKLNYISNHDPLTGLANRRSFETQLKQKLEIMNHNKKSSSLILIDIDHFKSINDKYGHPIGDIVLKEISDILLKSIKNSDLATRWGGEEFLILLFETPVDVAYELANKIRIEVEKKTILIDNFKINITVSIGIAQLKSYLLNNFNSSYTLADNALYRAKNNGRNQVVAAKE